MSNQRSEPLRFRGGPTRLAAALRLPESDLASKSVEVILKDTVGRIALRPVTRTDPSLSLIRLRLPRTTPPGTYEGTVRVGDKLMPFVAQIEPRPHLRFFPGRLIITAPAGAMVDADLTLVNSGNVPVSIEAKHTFCIFDGTGIDRAFFAALSEEKLEGEKRINRLLDELANLHGGLVRLRVEEGVGDIAPGESRELHVVLRFSDRLHAGARYAGVWSLSSANYSVRINVTEGRIPSEETK
ncbi:MAG: hypothetical protein WAV20_05730 [Blastocatellia bacterium]